MHCCIKHHFASPRRCYMCDNLPDEPRGRFVHRRHYFFPPKITTMFASRLWISQKSRDKFEDITELEFLSQFQKWFQVKIFDEDVLWSLKVGFLDYFFQHFTQHCFIWCPSDSTVSEDAVLNPRQLRYRHWLSMW